MEWRLTPGLKKSGLSRMKNAFNGVFQRNDNKTKRQIKLEIVQSKKTEIKKEKRKNDYQKISRCDILKGFFTF